MAEGVALQHEEVQTKRLLEKLLLQTVDGNNFATKIKHYTHTDVNGTKATYLQSSHQYPPDPRFNVGEM